MAGTTTPSERPGRPRLFDDKTERRIIMDAAIEAMKRSGYANMSIAGILAEANLSTSSFYRHFESKDALAEALIRRDCRSARRFIDESIAAAPGPVEALTGWLDAVLVLYFERRRAQRVAVMSTPAILSSPRMTDLLAEMRWMLAEPLVDVLRAGHKGGVLFSPDPVGDAATMFALASAVGNMPRARPRSRAAARAQVIRFAWPALHIEQTPPPGKIRRREHAARPQHGV